MKAGTWFTNLSYCLEWFPAKSRCSVQVSPVLFQRKASRVLADSGDRCGRAAAFPPGCGARRAFAHSRGSLVSSSPRQSAPRPGQECGLLPAASRTLRGSLCPSWPVLLPQPDLSPPPREQLTLQPGQALCLPEPVVPSPCWCSRCFLTRPAGGCAHTGPHTGLPPALSSHSRDFKVG